MKNDRKYTYYEIDNTSDPDIMSSWAKDIKLLISNYYTNPNQIFGMLCQQRQLYLATDSNNNLVSLFSTKYLKIEDKAFSYFGLLASLPGNNYIVICLMFRYIEKLFAESGKLRSPICCYGFTTNFIVFNIVQEFFRNVYPKNKRADDGKMKFLTVKPILFNYNF